ncbi:MAG TPA: response regulator transcription factor [Trebonia sp.]|nr:response regulator transcription factor [Trebonia sp.]
MSGERVLLIEDEQDIAFGIRVLLERGGLRVSHARDGADGLRTFHKFRPDLVILDIGLPGMDGWTVLERIRDLSDVPILMLTAHGHESEKVRGLTGGADDYLLKPFGSAELSARAQALLRRSRSAGSRAGGDGGQVPEVFDDGVVAVNFATHQVTAGGGPVDLTPTEFRLLTALVRNQGQVLSAEKLLELAWSDPYGIGPERVKYSVLRLRRKLGASAAGARIEAVRGFGYRYRAAERASSGAARGPRAGS